MNHSSIVGSKPLSHSCGQISNIASAFRAVWAQSNSTSTLDLVPALAALNEGTYYECEIRSQCAEVQLVKGLGFGSNFKVRNR